MRKILAVILMGGFLLASVPSDVLAGDPHAVRNRWNGVGIGIAVATLGGLLVGALSAPVIAAPPVAVAPPRVVYSPPPVVYASPPVVYAPPPVVVYSRPPVVVHRGWAPPGHWKHHR